MISTTPPEPSVAFSSSGASEATSSPLALETPNSSVSAWRETSVESNAESNAESFAQGSEKPKKKRRKGRIIGGLREQLSKSVTVRQDIPQPQPLHIAPSSTGSRLTATELKGVLVIHLVSMASGEILAFSKPRLLDLAEIVSQVRGRAIRLENVNGYQEVLLTCLAAYSIFSLVAYDAITAAAQERSLEISDSELTSLGWHADPFTTATAFNAFPLDADLADHRKKLRRVRAGAMVLRALAQHQSLGVIPNPGDVLPAFRRLWALSDEHLASVFALGPGFELDPAHERLDSSGREVLARAQQRYLACLKVFIFLLQPLSESPSVDLYSRGLLLNSLQQLLPGWLELTVEGAVHFEKGEGVLKSADFGYDDLRRLLRFLQNVGTISARSEAYRVDLEKAMVALGVPLEAPSHTTLDRPIQLPNLPSPEESPDGADRWARVLVENALEEIGT